MAETTFASDTTKRTVKQWALGLFVLLIGLTIAHLGVTLFLLSALGTDTFTVLVEGLAKTIGISIGTCHVAVCVVLMVVMFFTTKGYVKPGTVLCAFCGGWIIDFFMWILGDMIHAQSHIAVRIAAMLIGCVILAFGMALVMRSNSGTGPNDLVAMILSDKLNKKHNIAFRWVRIACDVLFVAVGFLLGGTVGAGTLVAAFLTGPLVQIFLPIHGKMINRFFPTLN